MKYCFISICIPAYEKAAPLERLLESIQKQHFKDFEVIITDDSKTDAVERIADQFKNSLPLQYFRNDLPAGMGRNWNSCIEKASGEWIKIMHDDDWFDNENALGKFAATARSTGISFIFSAANNVVFKTNSIEEDRLTGKKKRMLEDSILSLFLLNVIGHPSVTMFRKDTAITFDEQFRWLIDIDFYIRYLQKHDGKYIYIDETLINITNDISQVSESCYKNPYVEVPEYLDMLAKFKPRLHLKNKYAFFSVWELVRKYSIKHLAQFSNYGFTGILPEKTSNIIRYQKMIPRIILKQTPWNRWLMEKFFNKLRMH